MILTLLSGISADTRATDDVQLMQDLCAGKTEAFEMLFGRYARLVHRITADILNDKAEAEDVTQEIFFEVYRKAYLYDATRGSVRTWLLQYAYHRAFRRKARLDRRVAYRGEPIDAVEIASRQCGPHLTRDECRWVLRAGLAQLPHRQRTTLELTCFEELTLKDVAARLGVSVGCTRHYYYRGLARLQAWARLTDGPAPIARAAMTPGRRAVKGAGRGASAADKAGGATDRARRRCVRI